MEPPTFLLDTKYPDIERAVGFYLQSHNSDESRLNGLNEAYINQTARSDHHEQRLLTALDAIEHIKSMDWKLRQDLTCEMPIDYPDSFEIGGMTIRVKPTLIVSARLKGSKERNVGVVKAYFGKTSPLAIKAKTEEVDDCERGVLFATLLHWFAEEALAFSGQADPTLCLVGDVFNEKVHFAAKRYVQRRKLIEAVAQEISDRWEPIRDRVRKIAPKIKKHP